MMTKMSVFYYAIDMIALQILSNWMDGWKILLILTYDYKWQKLHFACLVFLHTCKYFILLFHFWLFTITV